MRLQTILNEYDDRDDNIDRFEEIMGEVMELTHEAIQIVRDSGDRMALARAQSYWEGHIRQAVEKEDWFSMAATLNELRDEGNQR